MNASQAESAGNTARLNPLYFFFLPLAVSILSLGLAFLGRLPIWLEIILAGGFLVGLLYFFVGMIVWFVRKRKAAGFLSLICFFIVLFSSVPISASYLVQSLTGPASDDFADDLKLPSNVILQEPGDLSQGREGPMDSFQTALLASIVGSGGGDPRITTSIPSLGVLQENHPDLLQRYFSSHPGWRVFAEGRNRFATRRWMIEGKWQISGHGYYSDFGGAPGSPVFQTKTTLGFTGKPWARGRTEMLPSNKTVAPSLDTAQWVESRIAFDEGGVLVELFEQSEFPERRMTKATLAQLEKELAPLAAKPTWETAEAILPEGFVVTGPPSMTLWNAFQGGIYNAEIRCNPGEPGMIYLKAFEITKGTRLSSDSLKERASEWIGWSNDPTEQFLSEVHFTIYEGDWGQYYGARFEVWFVPESGKSERKLLESNWKIEGWMR